ncbi:hypothetical protein FOXB_15409 [Fusarium oxysporum f. sp. conglutinans Fo5176]|uniref:Zn(2)-C6 fungal-type domain-containing protein n=1 Tax=Fusarium oxysporum (strain Fo5176) TaxID=660025 RepID=F9G9S7_FUSOF|nr:hypothetical protein FOXB_15409 [Fusarium oxysporum f. sp. conglutinans Fo5176]
MAQNDCDATHLGRTAEPTTFNRIPAIENATIDERNIAPKHMDLRNAGRKRRLCLISSKRKLKCDKQKPCTSCRKAGNDCIFPDILPSQIQAATTPGLVHMLHRLGKAVQTLEPRESEHDEAVPRPSNFLMADDDDQADIAGQPAEPTRTLHEASSEQEDTTGINNQNQRRGPQEIITSSLSNYVDSQGNIICDHGRDVYVRGWFWDDGSTEISSGFL